MIILFLSLLVKTALGSGIFERNFPNRFACVNDIYKIASKNYTIKPQDLPNVPLNVTRVSYDMETLQNTAIERELSEILLKLRDESKNLEVGLTYPYQYQRFLDALAKDYVYVTSELTQLHLLKTLTYDSSVYRLFASNSYNHFNGKTTEIAKFNLCSAIVYANVANIISDRVDKVYKSINKTKSRVQINLINLPTLKKDGLISKYIDSAGIYSISTIGFGILFYLSF
ncbi:BmGPI14, Conserved protein (piroplasmida) [Babesia microti strain RI]|uniref:BmGPI14, Conserved protein (Piroplasmida) n=1 Tax=Babesia microti (strain RI) TaxID=1133968 RepID=A0A0K3ATR5_BABMR|nr:BmGPI14, Conserved protein (piroplasmida) [Babesia microti strain RI]CTQ40936.1 BmGPI14, Conserved protein (piroplasmida) [Babesia microti strain RI]|eukprot:XP_012648947.1 BmGPI14, Conserved protein (piroplasmida) [Babesia microti strain RI]